MAITPSSIQALQAAGQAVDAARLEFVEQTKDLNERVAAAMASNPFAVENDGLYEAWKRVSRISHDLQQVEAQLRGLYTAASELVGFGTVEVKYAKSAPRLLPPSSVVEQSVADVEPKKGKRKAKVKARASKLGRKSKNTDLLTRYLRKVLNHKKPVRLTLAQMTERTGIPSGSIHAAVKAVLDAGVVRLDGPGNYRLA
ncbi:hypothetical protein [Rhodoferax sp.]|uniref:hypothetical protein n=1 Tax=Rhodoferax sp. TaxID=50421 RepID=UPI002753236F|nr:hypothetical protein [Rhodoferax sp.]